MTETAETAHPWPARLPTITRQRLRKYNGRDGTPVYVALNGIVYDVTDSFLWPKGRHYAEHEAGADLTRAMDQAPHGDDVLKRFPIVGTLGDD